MMDVNWPVRTSGANEGARQGEQCTAHGIQRRNYKLSLAFLEFYNYSDYTSFHQ